MRNRIASTLSGLAILALAVATTACGGSANAAGTVEHEITIGTGTVGTMPTETAPAATTPAAGGGTAPAGDPVAGKAIFTSAACAGCHTLKDAGATGAVGPNLDTSIKAQSAAAVATQVTNGGAVMPAFKGQLSDADIANVAAYVASVAGK